MYIYIAWSNLLELPILPTGAVYIYIAFFVTSLIKVIAPPPVPQDMTVMST